MIQFKQGNLLDSECQVLVNTVNTVGVMGKGIALQFKEAFPIMFTDYKQACKEKILEYGGDLWWWQYMNQADLFTNKPFINRFICCFATKEDWRNPSRIEWVKKGLENFVYQYPKFGIQSVAFPKLGCNNGQLRWEEAVKPLMIKYLDNLDIFVEIYE